jgi:ribosomal protein L32
MCFYGLWADGPSAVVGEIRQSSLGLKKLLQVIKEDIMICPNCGHPNELTSRVCMNCGKPLFGADQFKSPGIMEPGRGGLILTLGILSITCFGPLVGIPAWIMGNKDLKKIDAGIIPITERGTTKGGMICGIIGTLYASVLIFLGILAAVGISIFGTQSIEMNKAAMVNDVNEIAAYAYNYKMTSEPAEGQETTYIGFELPELMAGNENGTYYTQVVSPKIVKITAISAQNENNRITVYLSYDGNLYEWTFTGEFQ